jgi:hypothetical protein
MPSPRPEIKGEGAGEEKGMARQMYSLFPATPNGTAEIAAKVVARFAGGSTGNTPVLALIGRENAADQSLCGLSRHARIAVAAASVHWHESPDSNTHGRCQEQSRRCDVERSLADLPGGARRAGGT